MASYQELLRQGKLRERVVKALASLGDCYLCPRRCKVNRLAGKKGKCHTARLAWVSSYGPHFGEEAPLVGHNGSGTIFFAHCNLRCLFCQNYTISQLGEGKEVTPEELAEMMLDLESKGCHNINLVSPTHVVPQILEALEIAAARGLSIPLVYNTGGYDMVRTLRFLDGVVDIYMPDMKYADAETAYRYSGIHDYPVFNRLAVREMHRQVGELVLDEDGVAVRGLLVRHLVLPGGLAGTREIARFIAHEISKNTYLNVMAQYHPAHKAYGIPEVARPLFPQEYAEAVRIVQEEGLERLDSRFPRRARLLQI